MPPAMRPKTNTSKIPEILFMVVQHTRLSPG